MQIFSVHSVERIIKFGQELTKLWPKVTGVPLIMPHRVDASMHTVSAVLTQTGDGTEFPAAFSCTKLSQAQMALSTI